MLKRAGFNYCDHQFPINSGCPHCALGLICERINLFRQSLNEEPHLTPGDITYRMAETLNTVYRIANQNR